MMENAIIKDVYFGLYERTNNLTLLIQLEGDGWSQGFGGYNIDNSNLTIIFKMLFEVFEVRSLEELKGKNVRIITEEGKAWESIVKIGHIYKRQFFDRKLFTVSTKVI